MVQPYIEDYVPGEIVRAYNRRNTGPMKKVEVENLPTCEIAVPISPYSYDTNKLVAHILTPQEQIPTQELFAEAVDSAGHTVDLIHECVRQLEEVKAVPRLIMLSQLRYLALGELTLQLKYYYRGVHVPFYAAGKGCMFDVRVYGATLVR